MEPHKECPVRSEFPLDTGIQSFADFGHETQRKIRKSFSPVAKRTRDFFDKLKCPGINVPGHLLCIAYKKYSGSFLGLV